jgi:mono/diheme cytochrome c family protein
MQKDMFGKSILQENKMMMRVFVFVLLLIPGLVKAQTKKPVTKKPAISTSKTTSGSGNTLKSSISRGQIVYTKFCLTCHQVDGSGVPNLNPPLIRTQWTLGSKTVLIEQVLKGSNGKIEIDGETFHNTMPPLATLTDQQIADVLTYVRNNFGNKASMVTPAEVKAVRMKTKTK